MQWPVPLLKAGHAEPQRRSILVSVICRMACGQVVVRICLVKHGASLVCPSIGTETVNVITEIPSDVGKRRNARHGVAEVAVFILTTRSRVNLRVVPSENHGDNHIPFPRITQYPLEFLPVGAIESRVVKTWTF